ncbi:MAG: PAS domain S-box protein [Rhodospirillaceae bacterium]|nr:PAS domain S-box protein [Rhodospirillales bacterium]
MTDIFRQAFDSTATPTAITDATGRLVEVNTAFAEAAGRDPARLMGARAADILDGLPERLTGFLDVAVVLKPAENIVVRAACTTAPLPSGGAVLTLRPAPEMAGWPYQMIVEAMEDGITIRAADGRIIGSNRAARQILGGLTDPYFIRPDGTPLPPADHPAIMALDTGNAVAAIIGIKATDGKVRWIQVNSVLIEHPEAGTAVVSSFAEINTLVETQRRLAESERRFRAIFDHTFEFIGLLDMNGRLIEVNATALNFIGKELTDVVGLHFADTPWWTHSPEDQARLRDGIKRASAGEFVRFETTHTDNDGVVATIDFSLRAVRDQAGNVAFLIPEGRDITHLKQAEDALLAAKLEAEAANRAKSTFLATISHELRTPLNAVIGFSDTIISEVFGPLGNARYLEYVQLIHSAGSHLRDIIEDILDVARIEIGEVVLREEAMNVQTSLDGVVRLMALKAEERHVDLSVAVPTDLPLLYADPLRIRQIVLNLLSNAIKFTPAQGRVILSVAHSPEGLTLTVSDTGIGIRAEDLDSIWTPFFQSDMSLARRFGGNGLGLPIVRHYVTAHDGTIGVDSVPGKGTTFTVSLPAGRLRGHDGGNQMARGLASSR